MPISCTNTGRQIWKSLEQNVTIGSMFFLFLLVIIGPILGLISQQLSKNHDSELCKKYGIFKIEENNDSVVIIFIILALVSFMLTIMSSLYLKSNSINRLDWITPLITGVIAILAVVTAVTIGKDTQEISNPNIDPKIKEWCYNENLVSKNLGYVIAVFLGISIASFIAWFTSLVAISCEIY